jgi:site-specific DNA-methyltransferase (adenine-specific)
MKRIPAGAADMILSDLPYGSTQNKWDSVLPMDGLWAEYKRVIKRNGAIVLTAQSPFDKVLGCSNLPMLKYEWIWEKTSATGFLNAKRAPLKAHENILVFYQKPPVYNPQMTHGHNPVHSYTKHTEDGSNYGKTSQGWKGGGSTSRYPRSVLTFPTDKQKCAIHPTQKPVALFEYLIKTYSNEGDVILDSCMGSGTTAVACMNTGRSFIGFENDRQYYTAAEERISERRKEFRGLSENLDSDLKQYCISL